MKKLFLISLIAVFFAACQSPVEDAFQDEVMLKSAVKVDLCHLDEYGNFISISVSEKALEAHMAHGDKYPYSPEGNYVFQKKVERPGGIIIDEYSITLFAKDADGNFEGNGMREYEDNTYYVKIAGNVDEDGFINFTIWQYKNDPEMTGSPMNWWILEGVVDECEGIISVTCVESRESTHEWSLVEKL